MFLVADGENGVELFQRQVLGSASASVASDNDWGLFGCGHGDHGQDEEEETDDERGRRPTFVSGSKKYVYTVANRFHPAYQLNAPWGVNACSSAGHVKEMIKLKPQHVAVAKDMPVSRRYSGNASAGVSATPARTVSTRTGVSERHGAFARRVDRHEEVDAQRDHGHSGGVVLAQLGVAVRHQERPPSEEQAKGHDWEGGEQEVAAAERVDGVDCWDGEEPVDLLISAEHK